jgi:hypothetical protein
MLRPLCSNTRAQVEELRNEVDMTIAKFLKQEGTEKETAEQLQAVIDRMERLEHELAHWVAEDRKQNRLISVLSAHREMKVREAAR